MSLPGDGCTVVQRQGNQNLKSGDWTLGSLIETASGGVGKGP